MGGGACRLCNTAYAGNMVADSVSHNLDFVLKLNTVKYDKVGPRAEIA